MAKISDQALSTLKDAWGIHDFTEVERAQIEVLAEQLKEILSRSKGREKQVQPKERKQAFRQHFRQCGVNPLAPVHEIHAGSI